MDFLLEDQLYDAISRNDIYNIRKIIRKDVNINNICSNGLTPLGAAVHLGNIHICEILIENYQSRRDEYIHKNKKLCLSLDNDITHKCKNENKNIGYYVVRKDCDGTNDDEITPDETPEGMEALEWDVEIKDTDEVSHDESYSSLYKWYADILNRTSDFLKNPLPSDINQIDRYGRTAMHYAADNGDAAIVQLLISNGCNVNNTCTSESMSPLHLAASKGHADTAFLLVSAGARIDHTNNTRATALHLAASRGHRQVVQLLLQRGASVNALDSHERSSLVRAVTASETATAELLLRHGAHVNAEDVHGHTPLCEAVWAGCLPVVQTLICAGAKVTQSHHLLHYAVQSHQPDVVRMLVSAGSVVNLRDANGNTPLILAARTGHTDIVQFLLDHGAQVNAANTITGTTALYEAVECLDEADAGRFERLLRVLVRAGVHLNLTTNWLTPLQHAIACRKSQLACCLVRHGCDISWSDGMHRDCLQLARMHGDLQVVRALVLAGRKLDPTVPLNSSMVDRWLAHASSNPLPLADLCRITVRRQLGQQLHVKLPRLPLPARLLHYLHMQDVR